MAKKRTAHPDSLKWLKSSSFPVKRLVKKIWHGEQMQGGPVDYSWAVGKYGSPDFAVNTANLADLFDHFIILLATRDMELSTIPTKAQLITAGVLEAPSKKLPPLTGKPKVEFVANPSKAEVARISKTIVERTLSSIPKLEFVGWQILLKYKSSHRRDEWERAREQGYKLGSYAPQGAVMAALIRAAKRKQKWGAKVSRSGAITPIGDRELRRAALSTPRPKTDTPPSSKPKPAPVPKLAPMSKLAPVVKQKATPGEKTTVRKTPLYRGHWWGMACKQWRLEYVTKLRKSGVGAGEYWVNVYQSGDEWRPHEWQSRQHSGSVGQTEYFKTAADASRWITAQSKLGFHIDGDGMSTPLRTKPKKTTDKAKIATLADKAKLWTSYDQKTPPAPPAHWPAAIAAAKAAKVAKKTAKPKKAKPPAAEKLELTAVKSKMGPTYKISFEGNVGRIRVRGQSTVVHIGIDKLTPRLASSILEGRVWRSDGSHAVTPHVQREVEKAVLAELKRLESTQGKRKGHPVAPKAKPPAAKVAARKVNGNGKPTTRKAFGGDFTTGTTEAPAPRVGYATLRVRWTDDGTKHTAFLQHSAPRAGYFLVGRRGVGQPRKVLGWSQYKGNLEELSGDHTEWRTVRVCKAERIHAKAAPPKPKRAKKPPKVKQTGYRVEKCVVRRSKHTTIAAARNAAAGKPNARIRNLASGEYAKKRG